MMDSRHPALQAQPTPHGQAPYLKALPPGWGIVLFPEPPHGLDIVGPDGRTLVTVGPGKAKGSQTNPGSWPEGTRWESWFRTPSGRRCSFSSHLWETGEWRRIDQEILALPRIRIDLDWGGAFAWTQYRQAASLEAFFGNAKGVGALEEAFQEWQARFEAKAPWAGDPEPRGGWEQFSEDGLTLCRALATWVGQDGYVRYSFPPRRLRLKGRCLMLAWDPVSGGPRHGESDHSTSGRPADSATDVSLRMGR